MSNIFGIETQATTMATSNNPIDWAPFCRELAKKLLAFKGNRKRLLKKIKLMYKIAGMPIPTLQATLRRTKEFDELVDIDPFTVFSLFCRKFGKTDSPNDTRTRARLVTALASKEVFDIPEGLVPENVEEDMDFNDMPKITAIAASFCMSATGKDIDKLWDLLEAALNYAEDPSDAEALIECFDSALGINSIGVRKLTMALSWIVPEEFMNLSKSSIGYIPTLEGVPTDVVQKLNGKITGESYLEIIKGLKDYLAGTSDTKDFRALNLKAYYAREDTPKPPRPDPRPKPQPAPGPAPRPGPKPEAYSKADFLREVFMSDLQYDTLVSTLKSKKNVILKGVPGVGKTFAARRLAYSMMGEKDDNRVKFVQFHQSYSHEDFVKGYKPREEGGYNLQNGIFYKFCKDAERDKGNDYFFIIDEINRGNTSKIFGELLMLIENDHREEPTTLANNEELFSVPQNLYIIGMMNTADRSLAMIDYALRRRFSFIEMDPAFDTAGFKELNKENFKSEIFAQLIGRVKELNSNIVAEKSLGPGFRIGHSYFCAKEEYTYEKMYAVVNYEILPLLEEYCFDSPDKLDKLGKSLRDMFPKGSLKRE